jgi:hypothetical protein
MFIKLNYGNIICQYLNANLKEIILNNSLSKLHNEFINILKILNNNNQNLYNNSI